MTTVSNDQRNGWLSGPSTLTTAVARPVVLAAVSSSKAAPSSQASASNGSSGSSAPATQPIVDAAAVRWALTVLCSLPMISA